MGQGKPSGLLWGSRSVCGFHGATKELLWGCYGAGTCGERGVWGVWREFGGPWGTCGATVGGVDGEVNGGGAVGRGLWGVVGLGESMGGSIGGLGVCWGARGVGGGLGGVVGLGQSMGSCGGALWGSVGGLWGIVGVWGGSMGGVWGGLWEVVGGIYGGSGVWGGSMGGWGGVSVVGEGPPREGGRGTRGWGRGYSAVGGRGGGATQCRGRGLWGSCGAENPTRGACGSVWVWGLRVGLHVGPLTPFSPPPPPPGYSLHGPRGEMETVEEY